jgi:hypothetical protein
LCAGLGASPRYKRTSSAFPIPLGRVAPSGGLARRQARLFDRINRIFRIPVDVITMFEARTCTPTILIILSKKNDSTIL